MGTFGKSILRGAGSEIGRSMARSMLNRSLRGSDATPINVQGGTHSKASVSKKQGKTLKSDLDKKLEQAFPAKPETGLTRAAAIIREMDRMFNLHSTTSRSELQRFRGYVEKVNIYLSNVGDLIEDASKEEHLLKNMEKLEALMERFEHAVKKELKGWVSSVETSVLNVDPEQEKKLLLKKARERRNKDLLKYLAYNFLLGLLFTVFPYVLFIQLYQVYKVVKLLIKRPYKKEALGKIGLLEVKRNAYQKEVSMLKEHIQ